MKITEYGLAAGCQVIYRKIYGFFFTVYAIFRMYIVSGACFFFFVVVVFVCVLFFHIFSFWNALNEFSYLVNFIQN